MNEGNPLIDFRRLKNRFYADLYGYRSVFDAANARLSINASLALEAALRGACSPPAEIEDASAFFKSEAGVKCEQADAWYFDLVWLLEEYPRCDAARSAAASVLDAATAELWLAFVGNLARDAAAMLDKRYPGASHPSFARLLQLGCAHDDIVRVWPRFKGNVERIAGYLFSQDLTRRSR